MIRAMEQAIKIYRNKTKYAILRKNCREAVIDVKDVARNWNQEFYRIKNKLYTESALIEEWE